MNKINFAVITGANSPVGSRIVELMLSAGKQPILVLGRTKPDVVSRNTSNALNFFFYDIERGEHDPRLLRFLSHESTRISTFINCAGGATQYGGFVELDIDDWISTFNLNVFGLVNLLKLITPYLDISTTVRLLNISSIAGSQPGAFNPHYSAAKAACNNLFKSLANSLSKQNILVNTISPGPFESPSLEKNIEESWNKYERENYSLSSFREHFMKTEKSKIPLGKFVDIDTIAELAVFLCSIHNKCITGVDYKIDCGKSR